MTPTDPLLPLPIGKLEVPKNADSPSIRRANDVHSFMSLRHGYARNAEEAAQIDTVQLLAVPPLRDSVGILSKEVGAGLGREERARDVLMAK